jgi:hypothetical protein
MMFRLRKVATDTPAPSRLYWHLTVFFGRGSVRTRNRVMGAFREVEDVKTVTPSPSTAVDPLIETDIEDWTPASVFWTSQENRKR